MRLATALILSYLVGSIPWSLLAARLLGGVDLRRVGSGNLGATNVFRALGAWTALAVLALDAAKGVVAVLLIARLAPAALGAGGVATLCGLAAILGHMFPFYLGFRGGKGIATSAGVFAALEPTAFWVCLGVFAISFLASGGIVSLGSLLGSLALPIAIGIAAAARDSVDWTRLLLVCALVVVVWVRHAANIRRLLRGDEKGLLRQKRNTARTLTGAGEEVR